MTTIEHRIEADGEQPDYSGREFTEEEIAEGAHRRFVGGVWDTHGQRQLDFLIGRGLKPEHRVLDIGCGCFRAGRLFIDYLEPGHYYGVDANHSLMQAGYDVELSEEQRSRLPIENLRANDRFDVDFGVPVDFAMAQSVFTHVSINHIRLCLFRAAKSVRPGGSFFATFFERPRSTPIDMVLNTSKPKPFFTEKNVFWYYRSDLEWAARFSPWRVNYIGDWGHPANQRMVEFIRLTDEEWAAAKTAAKKAAPTAAQKPAQKGPAAQPPLRQELARFTRRGRRWLARRLDPKR